MNISKSLSRIINSIQYIHSEHIVLLTLLNPISPIVQVICQLSSLTIAYPNLVFNSSSLKFLVTMSASCIPPSHQTSVCRFQSSPFFKECVIMEIYLVCLFYSSLLAIHTSNFCPI